MSDCLKNLSKDQIILEFAKNDDLGKCNKCDNLEYNNGIMCCKLLDN